MILFESPHAFINGDEFVELEIRLFGSLLCGNEQLPFFGKNEFIAIAPDGLSTGGLMEWLQLPPFKMLIVVNGIAANKDLLLAANDRVGIFPPIGGG